MRGFAFLGETGSAACEPWNRKHVRRRLNHFIFNCKKYRGRKVVNANNNGGVRLLTFQGQDG